MEVLAADFNKLNNFISGWFIDHKVCDDLINKFENSSKTKPGILADQTIDNSSKKSTDLTIDAKCKDADVQAYYIELNKVLEQYKNKYKHCSEWQDQWSLVEPWNIQKYNPGEAFFGLHCERAGIDTCLRHLVFMTYLNDVTDQGQTEWYYQKLKVKPRKGLTVIWGTDWTFVHKGITSPTQTKYIATGWYSYVKERY